jgi:hypothetical protein
MFATAGGALAAMSLNLAESTSASLTSFEMRAQAFMSSAQATKASTVCFALRSWYFV